MIELKTEDELRIMREAGQIVGQTLAQIREMIRPGLNLLEIEQFVRDEFKRKGAKETFYQYTPDKRRQPPYPSNICISIRGSNSFVMTSAFRFLSRWTRSTIWPARHHRFTISMTPCRRQKRPSMVPSICWASPSA